MAELVRGPSVLLAGSDLLYVADALAAALKARALRDGGTPPRLREITETVQAAAAEFRADVLSRSDPGTTEFRNAVLEASCAGSAGKWLTVGATAALLHCSEGYARRLCRRKTLDSVKASSNGAWLISEAAVLERLGDRDDEAA